MNMNKKNHCKGSEINANFKDRIRQIFIDACESHKLEERERQRQTETEREILNENDYYEDV